jgi:hypothetical protein
MRAVICGESHNVGWCRVCSWVIAWAVNRLGGWLYQYALLLVMYEVIRLWGWGLLRRRQFLVCVNIWLSGMSPWGGVLVNPFVTVHELQLIAILVLPVYLSVRIRQFFSSSSPFLSSYTPSSSETVTRSTYHKHTPWIFPSTIFTDASLLAVCFQRLRTHSGWRRSAFYAASLPSGLEWERR